MSNGGTAKCSVSGCPGRSSKGIFGHSCTICKRQVQMLCLREFHGFQPQDPDDPLLCGATKCIRKDFEEENQELLGLNEAIGENQMDEKNIEMSEADALYSTEVAGSTMVPNEQVKIVPRGTIYTEKPGCSGNHGKKDIHEKKTSRIKKSVPRGTKYSKGSEGIETRGKKRSIGPGSAKEGRLYS